MENRPLFVKARTLTPLVVGDGDRLSPLVDYFLDGGRLHRIHPQRLAEWLDKNGKIEDYMEAVRTVSRFAKDKFWKDYIGLRDLRQIASGESYALRYTENPIEIRTIVKNADSPYLPGSSIKGAIKTALLHRWLTEQRKDVLQEMVDALLRDATRFGGKDVLQFSINQLLEPKGKDEKGMTDKVTTEFNNLRVSDSQPLEPASIEIAATKRLHFMRGTFDIPVVSEAVAAGQELRFALQALPYFKHPELQSLNTEGVKALFPIINTFSRAHAGLLLDTLEDNRAAIEQRDNGELYDTLFEWLEELYEDIKSAPDNTAYLQVGAGKTYYANSCGLAIFDSSQEAFNALRRIYRLSKSRGYLFPVTAAMGTHNYLPQGWIKMTC